MSHGIFHGKSIEEIVEIRWKEYEMRKAKEREERAALLKAHAENKADLTAPKAVQPAPAAHAHPVLGKIKHVFHID